MHPQLLHPYLKMHSRASHERIDTLIMTAQPFASLAHYGRFLQVQAVFFQTVETLFRDPGLNTRLPGLAARSRWAQLLQDLQDLHIPQAHLALPAPCPQPQQAQAIGWLYCAEGSNLGAEFLFQAAQSLGCTATHGARHLCPHAGGRAQHWQTFTTQLNQLGEQGSIHFADALQGTIEAFGFYEILLRKVFALD